MKQPALFRLRSPPAVIEQLLLNQIRQTVNEALTNQNYPFSLLVEKLQPYRDFSRSPIFQTSFNLQQLRQSRNIQNLFVTEIEENINWGELKLGAFEIPQQEGQNDLDLEVVEGSSSIKGSFKYNTDLFNSQTIERMVVHFQNLLEAIVENPDQNVGHLPLLLDSERHQLLVEWNNTATDYPKDKCIHFLFEEQVEKTPDAIAVVFESEQLTYQQLNQRANKLAHHLQTLGVRPEVLVGICVERSIEMVVGLLGILKAGGAYVPLDPNYPQDRLSYMLEDSAFGVLVTQSELVESIPEHNAQVVCLDTDWGVIEQNSKGNLDVGGTSDNLAYVIYTSGSTGKPKGVLVTHKNVVHSTTARLSYYNQTLRSFLLMSSVAFDSSVAGIFWSLCSGGSLIIPGQNSMLEPLSITKLIAKYQVSHLLCIPSYYTQLLQQGELQQFVTLSTAIVAGESSSKKLLELNNHLTSNTYIFNEYGPTEATVWSSVYSPQDKEIQNWLPIGRPIANTQIYILDSHLQPVPIGVPGELYIGGDGLARGYLNRPELTEEKFIPNPVSDPQSERLYKTGDLVRYLSDGNIEFLGRIDNQMKIRGFRIELGEIEAVLNTYPQIQQAVVITTEEIPENKLLVAYVVSEDKSLTSKQLREFLKQKLPEYMVPSTFVTLDTLPLTPNGKVDRKALPGPDGDFAREQEYVAPRTTIELQMTQIWSKVLNINSVGVQDNFFELGGHSLLAVRLMGEIQQQFQKNLPLATLFQNPTIEQLASFLGSSVNTSNSLLVPIKTSGNQPPLFCIHPVGGNVLCYADLARHLDLDYPVYGLQSLGLDGQQQPLTNLEEMASHYLEAIKQIQPQGPYHLIGWSMGGVIAYEMTQQLQAKNESVALLTLIDSYAPTVIPLPSEIDRAMIVNQLAQDWGGLYGQELDISLETLRKLEPDEQVKHLFEQAQQQAIFPSEIKIELLLALWDVFQANIIANYHYQPQAYSGSIILLNASETSPEVIEDPTHGWGHLVLDDIQTHTITGDHYTIMKAPQVKCLAEKLNEYLKLIQSQQDKNFDNNGSPRAVMIN